MVSERDLAARAEAMVAAWNARDLDAVVGAFSPDARLRDARGPTSVAGHAAIRADTETIAAAFPGVQLQIRRTLVAGGVVSVELLASGDGSLLRRGVLIADFDSAGRIVALGRYS